MELDDKLYKAFLEEMHALENFRLTYAAENPTTSIERDDPDVRRLIEALAFFSARTRLAGARSIAALRRRMFRQLLPYLMSPLPAMGMLRAAPNGRFSETVTLPRGAEIAISDERDRTAFFRTLCEVRILPLTLGRLETLARPAGGTRLVLPVLASHASNEAIGSLSLHLNYLNDLQASLRVLQAMRGHLTRVSVSFDDQVDENTSGAPCSVSWGMPGRAAAEASMHPVLRERNFFHFPATEMFINVEVPAPARNWRRFAICFDLGPGWPKNLRLSKEAFHLFTTPIVNLKRASAQPIVHDATQEASPIRHPDVDTDFELHSVQGVYRVADDVTVPLRSAALVGGSGSYELDDQPPIKGRRRPVLCLHLPESFESPQTISVDAEWLQRWFSSAIGQRLSIAPYRHSFVGLDWSLAGDLVPHGESALDDEDDDFTQILVLQNKGMLDRDDLDALLRALGSPWTGPFASLRDLLSEVEVQEAPAPGGAAGVKLVYHLHFKEHEPRLRPLLETFLVHVERVLDAWISEAPVEVRFGERR